MLYYGAPDPNVPTSRVPEEAQAEAIQLLEERVPWWAHFLRCAKVHGHVSGYTHTQGQCAHYHVDGEVSLQAELVAVAGLRPEVPEARPGWRARSGEPAAWRWALPPCLARLVLLCRSTARA